MAEQPDILWLMTDQHRFDCLGAAGHPMVRTPNLDALADEATTFTQAYCPSPICGPARAALMTGRFPPAAGAVANWMPLAEDAADRLLSHRLQQMGYLTALVGKLHLSPVRAAHGFDIKRCCDAPYGLYEPEEARHNDYLRWLERTRFAHDPPQAERLARESEQRPIADPAFWEGLPWIDDAHHMNTWVGHEAVGLLETTPATRPLMLKASFFGPHHPYRSAEPWDTMYDPDTVSLPETLAAASPGPVFDATKRQQHAAHASWSKATWRRLIARYWGQVSQIDHQIGRILEAWRRRGRWARSLIVFTADHGDHLGDLGLLGKGTMHESSVGVPLIVKPPDSTPAAAARCALPVNNLDLFGTMLDAAGDTRWIGDSPLACGSLWPMLQGEAHASRPVHAVIGQRPEQNLTMLRHDRFKLIRLARGEQAPVYQLHEIDATRRESPNRWTDPRYRETARAMRHELDHWWQQQRRQYPER